MNRLEQLRAEWYDARGIPRPTAGPAKILTGAEQGCPHKARPTRRHGLYCCMASVMLIVITICYVVTQSEALFS